MSKRNLIKYAQSMVEAGVMEKPLWLDAVRRVGVTEHRPGRRPPRLDFPEDKLLHVYYNKYPEAKLEPVDLTSYEPPTARRFVLRQMQLIEGGMARKEAFAAVEQEFFTRGENPAGVAAVGSSSSAGGSIIEQIQQQEEGELNSALQQYVDRHGPIPAPPAYQRRDNFQTRFPGRPGRGGPSAAPSARPSAAPSANFWGEP